MTDNRTTETVTDRLRALLDERGVEHYDGAERTLWGYEPTGEDTGIYRYAASEISGGFLQFDMFRVTPEQAIAATLGSERELIDLAHNAWSMALCAMQGMPIPAEWGNAVERGLRKYGIDVDEELAGFEEVDA